MKKSALGLVAAAVLFGGTAFGAETGTINSDYSVPLTTNTLCSKKIVKTNGSGMVKMEYNAEKRELAYERWVANLENVQMAHLHLGNDNKKGLRIAWLYPVSNPHPVLLPGRNDGLVAQGTLRGDNLIGPLQGKSIE